MVSHVIRRTAWVGVIFLSLACYSAIAADDDDEYDHKSLSPLSPYDYCGFVLVAIASFLAAGAGVGGGGILVPIFVVVMGFAPKQAIPLSNVTIFGASIMNTILNVQKRHPTTNR